AGAAESGLFCDRNPGSVIGRDARCAHPARTAADHEQVEVKIHRGQHTTRPMIVHTPPVATLEEELRSKLTAAIKARDLRTANCIRMVNTKVMERRTAKGFKGEVNDDLYRDVIGAYKKSLEKARKEFEPAGERAREQIAELDFEIEYLSQFL